MEPRILAAIQMIPGPRKWTVEWYDLAERYRHPERKFIQRGPVPR